MVPEKTLESAVIGLGFGLRLGEDTCNSPMQTLPVTLKPRETRVQELGMAVPAAVIFTLIFGGLLVVFMLETTKPQGGEWWGAIAFLSGLGFIVLLFLIAAG